MLDVRQVSNFSNISFFAKISGFFSDVFFVKIFLKSSKVYFCDPNDDVDDRLQYCGQTDPETGANVAGEGDKTAVFYDQDGSVTGTAETLLIDKRYTPMLTDECTFRNGERGRVTRTQKLGH